jgi:hypothetical protein
LWALSLAGFSMIIFFIIAQSAGVNVKPQFLKFIVRNHRDEATGKKYNQPL